MQQIQLEKAGFATPVTPISSGGMLRFAKSIEEHLNDLLNGRLPFERELFAAATELTISSGQITTTQHIHTVKAESGTTDDLAWITSDNNKSIILKAKAGHSIAIRHNAGNILVPGGVALGISGNVIVKLWCADNYWCVTGCFHPKINNSATSDPGSSDDASKGYSINSLWINTTRDRAWMCVDASLSAAVWKLINPAKNWYISRAMPSNNTLDIGCVNAQSGTAGNGTDSSNTYTKLTSAASIGNAIGWANTTFNLTRLDHDPVFECYIKTDADISAMRMWIGFASADVTNVDTLAAGTKFVGLRFSTVAADGGFKPVLNDGTNQSVGTALNTVAINTAYKIRIRVDSANARAYFSVNDGAEQVLSTNFPAITTEVTRIIRLIVTTASARVFHISFGEVWW